MVSGRGSRKSVRTRDNSVPDMARAVERVHLNGHPAPRPQFRRCAARVADSMQPTARQRGQAGELESGRRCNHPSRGVGGRNASESIRAAGRLRGQVCELFANRASSRKRGRTQSSSSSSAGWMTYTATSYILNHDSKSTTSAAMTDASNVLLARCAELSQRWCGRFSSSGKMPPGRSGDRSETQRGPARLGRLCRMR
jgi:hypothetical protein